ncbi:MAG TPA: response regulator [Puia sp.]|nr:response regulator [Puia sp.]
MSTRLNCVLLIDDDEPTNFLNRLMLEQAGCTRHIRIARNGQEALDYLRRCGSEGTDEFPRPDLILLDINMPAMDGWEFLDRYRLLPASTTRDIVVFMLTTSLNPDDETRARARPEVAGFENKPLGQPGLDRVLQAFFDRLGTGQLP